MNMFLRLNSLRFDFLGSPQRVLRAAVCCAVVGLLAAEQNALAAAAVPANSGAGHSAAVDMAASGSSARRTQVQLDEDVITGSSELPKVLYILPWRAAEGTAGLSAAPKLKARELFEPLDPDAHARLLQYRQRLVGDPADGG